MSPFTFTPEKAGCGIDRQKLIDDVNTALRDGKWEVLATFKEIKPQITVDGLKKFTNYRASFSTAYSLSTASRKHNIKLAVDKINGYVLKSGESFSFNTVVGERTEENGFQKVFAALARKGFDFASIKSALKKYNDCSLPKR